MKFNYQYFNYRGDKISLDELNKFLKDGWEPVREVAMPSTGTYTVNQNGILVLLRRAQFTAEVEFQEENVDDGDKRNPESRSKSPAAL